MPTPIGPSQPPASMQLIRADRGPQFADSSFTYCQPTPIEDQFVLSNFQATPGMSLDTRTDFRHDGKLVGSSCTTFEPTTPLRCVPAVLPNNGTEPAETVVLVNGIMTDLNLHCSDMQHLANTGCKVVGIHNATKGLMRDLAQCVGDKLELKIANNQAVDTATLLLEKTLEEGEPVHFIGHSQGSLVLSNAIGRVRSNLITQGMTCAEATDKLKGLRITTLGGAAFSYPEGPHYSHYINGFDVVPYAAGLGALSWLTAGADDRIVRFSKFDTATAVPPIENGVSNHLARLMDRTTHGPQNIYFPKINKHIYSKIGGEVEGAF